jgi:hypothetical protein
MVYLEPFAMLVVCDYVWYACVPGHVWHSFACIYYVCMDLLCMVVGACYVWLPWMYAMHECISFLSYETYISFLVINITNPLLSRMAPEMRGQAGGNPPPPPEPSME